MIKHRLKSKTNKLTCIQIVLIICLLVQFVLLFLFNLIKLNDLIDADASILFTHAFRMVSERSLLIPDWFYPSTLELDCSLLLVVPLYALTHNLSFSVALTNLLFSVFYIYVWVRLLKRESSSVRLLFANLVLIPYQIGMLDYYNMLFFSGGQYLIKTIIPILLIIILLESDENYTNGNKKTVPTGLAFVFYVLLLITSFSSGVYVPMMGIMPVVLLYFFMHFIKWEKISRSVIVLGCVSAISSLLCIAYNFVYFGDKKIVQQEKFFTTVTDMYFYPSHVFWGIFQLFGALNLDKLEVMSIAGFFRIIKIVLVCAILVSMLYTLKLWISGKASLLKKMLLAESLWGLFFLLFFMLIYGDYTFEYRYHLMGMIPALALLCLNIGSFAAFFKLSRQKIIVKSVLCLVLLSFVAFSYFDAFKQRNEEAIIAHEIVDKCKGLGYDKVYVYWDQDMSEYCRYYSGGEEYLRCLAGGKTYIRDYYRKYNESSIDPTNLSLFVFRCSDLIPFEIDADGGYFNDYYLYPVYQVDEFIILRVLPQE